MSKHAQVIKAVKINGKVYITANGAASAWAWVVWEKAHETHAKQVGVAASHHDRVWFYENPVTQTIYYRAERRSLPIFKRLLGK